MDSIYLDNNATTPLLPEVVEAMAECDRQGYANPASQHRAGRRARQVLEDAREEIAALLGANLTSARPDRLIFTSGGTEANNLALFGLAGSQPGHIAISAIEHPSVVAPAEQLARRGWRLTKLGVTPDGVLDLDLLRQLLPDHHSPLTTHPLTLVSLMLGNNETGVLQPVEAAAAFCRQAGVPLHTDAIQVAGKLPIDFRSLGVTSLSIAAHKFHGPRGIGALLIKDDVTLQPQLFGGFQQASLRPGTESITLAIGMAAALRRWHDQHAERLARLATLRDRLEVALLTGYPEAAVHGRAAARLPHTLCISFPGLERQALQIALDLAGVACSTGSACASGSTDPSPTLLAMGCDEPLFSSALRFSLGATTTAAEIDQAASRILMVCKDLQKRKYPGKYAAKTRNRT